MTSEQLRQYLTFYQDLGVKNLYRRAPGVQSVAAEKTAPAFIELPSLAPVGDTLAKISEDIGDCKRCRLCEQRNKIVFGSGNAHAELVFVGEGDRKSTRLNSSHPSISYAV